MILERNKEYLLKQIERVRLEDWLSPFFSDETLEWTERKLKGETYGAIAKRFNSRSSTIVSRTNKCEWQLALIDRWDFGLSHNTSALLSLFELSNKDQIKHAINEGWLKPGVSVIAEKRARIGKKQFLELCNFCGINHEDILSEATQEKEKLKNENEFRRIKEAVNLLSQKGYKIIPPN